MTLNIFEKTTETLTQEKNKEFISQINEIMYDFRTSKNDDQIKRFLELVASLERLGESSEEEFEIDMIDMFSKLNHEHFFQICEAIAQRNVKLQKKLRKARDTTNFTVSDEEIHHRTLVKEVTRLLTSGDDGIKSMQEDQEMIMMLHADNLLESIDPESQKIAFEYGQVFLSRPECFDDRALISANPKMFQMIKVQENPASEEQVLYDFSANPYVDYKTQIQRIF